MAGWSEFKIEKLFDVVKGSRLTKANMRPGEYRFIGSSAFQNGLTSLVENDEKIHPANTITVCYNGSVRETFYQDKPFWASDDVNVLYPKFDMTPAIALFICPLIRSLGQRYAFIDKWKKEVMEKELLPLPVTSLGQPDWDYMERYVAKILDESKLALECLQA